MTDVGNVVQNRIIAEQVAEAVIEAYVRRNPPEAPKAELPPALKLWGSIAAAVMTLIVTAGVIWMATTLNTLQLTVARMDERQQQDTTGQRVTENQKRIEKLEERIARIEHGKGE